MLFPNYPFKLFLTTLQNTLSDYPHFYTLLFSLNLSPGPCFPYMTPPILGSVPTRFIVWEVI